ncbi:uncharacterized protein LOC133931256 [Phragmites australis]|uniref:uncharacterized protein LOC133931256 n=1 Tax=Phragmites australis TaxID=29695 RepID=UPI002D774798|nr:uncharacterized protein LOC133931256 [Phragmites australis]
MRDSLPGVPAPRELAPSSSRAAAQVLSSLLEAPNPNEGAGHGKAGGEVSAGGRASAWSRRSRRITATACDASTVLNNVRGSCWMSAYWLGLLVNVKEQESPFGVGAFDFIISRIPY